MSFACFAMLYWCSMRVDGAAHVSPCGTDFNHHYDRMFRHAVEYLTFRMFCHAVRLKAVECLGMYGVQSSLWSHVSPCSRVLSIPHVSPCTVTGSCCMFRHAVDDLGTRLLHVSPCCRTFRHAVEELGT